MKNAIRAVMYVMVTVITAVVTNQVLSMNAVKAEDRQKELQDTVGYAVAPTSVSGFEMPEVSTYAVSRTIDTNAQEPVVMSVEFIQMSRPTLTMPSISMRDGNGVMIDTAEVFVDPVPLVEAYSKEYVTYSWDTKNKMNVIQTMWEFLVNQQGVEEHNAAAVIGAMMCEGYFGEEQKTHVIFSSIEDARKVLGKGTCGYGVAQWTYKTRQKNLLKYYELANEMFPEDFQTASIVAECCMLIEELKAYYVFDDLYSYTTIEDAVGRMCVIYERYDGCDEQWSNDSGLYELVSQDGSGKTRLAYAINIYNYFIKE